jgi:hypothetical protein
MCLQALIEYYISNICLCIRYKYRVVDPHIFTGYEIMHRKTRIRTTNIEVKPSS